MLRTQMDGLSIKPTVNTISRFLRKTGSGANDRYDGVLSSDMYSDTGSWSFHTSYGSTFGSNEK